MVADLPKKADSQECGADNYMESVEACGYEEGGSVNTVCDREGGFIVLHGLEEGKVKA